MSRIKRDFDYYVKKIDTCWLWTGSGNQVYGRYYDRDNNRTVTAHVYAWERKNGPLPPGKILHHRPTCSKRCCNPDHVTPLTKREHFRVHKDNGPGANLRKSPIRRGEKTRWDYREPTDV